MDIGLKIKELVEIRNYNKTQLAEELGMTENNLYKIFKKTSIDTELLEYISSLLGVKITYFFSDEVVEKNDTILSKKSKIEKKDTSDVFYERLLEEKDKRIGFLEEDVKFYKNIINNQFRDKVSSQSLGKNSEMEHSQPSTPTGQADKCEAESAPAGK